MPLLAQAGSWVYVTSDGQSKFYLDSGATYISGNTATVLSMRNYDFRDKHGDLSSTSHSIINCKTREFKQLEATYYDNLDGRGRMTAAVPAKNFWEPIPSKSPIEVISKLVCR